MLGWSDSVYAEWQMSVGAMDDVDFVARCCGLGEMIAQPAGLVGDGAAGAATNAPSEGVCGAHLYAELCLHAWRPQFAEYGVFISACNEASGGDGDCYALTIDSYGTLDKCHLSIARASNRYVDAETRVHRRLRTQT